MCFNTVLIMSTDTDFTHTVDIPLKCWQFPKCRYRCQHSTATLSSHSASLSFVIRTMQRSQLWIVAACSIDKRFSSHISRNKYISDDECNDRKLQLYSIDLTTFPLYNECDDIPVALNIFPFCDFSSFLSLFADTFSFKIINELGKSLCALELFEWLSSCWKFL